MSRELVGHICHLLQDLTPWGLGRYPLPVTVALNFYASGSFQGSTGDLCGILQASSHKCIQEVTNAIFVRAANSVHFNRDQANQESRAMGFTLISVQPQVQGVIDCTHVALRAPWHQAVNYVNLNGFHSLNVQLVCDHTLLICARFPECERLLHCQPLSEHRHLSVSAEAAGLAPRGQGLPTEDVSDDTCAEASAETRYNETHAATRTFVEQNIEMPKVRFQCLDWSGGVLQFNLQRVLCIVVACCALHNLPLQREEELPEKKEKRHVSSNEEDVKGDVAEQILDGEYVGHEAMVMSSLGRRAEDTLIATRFMEGAEDIQ
ncbi:putative nuclease HARBI1 [Scyliorhinus canicula]|uniref:putative nuclease HARBI1 n=1 Tax=Scyliorhinus canicula TaxID=7830 RepID=UPI0018F546F1|nr:putative nuclease HARBI1 [Scyliorhinus canicula]